MRKLLCLPLLLLPQHQTLDLAAAEGAEAGNSCILEKLERLDGTPCRDVVLEGVAGLRHVDKLCKDGTTKRDEQR